MVFERKQKVNVLPELKDEVFLSNQVDLRFYPDMFKLEFKQMNQQVDRVDEEVHSSLIINRRSIALTPMLMKQFVALVNRVLENYESQHGKIPVPKPVKKLPREVVKKKSSGYIG